MSGLLQRYRDTIVGELTQAFGYRSVMQVPRFEKITLNMGVGKAVSDKKLLNAAVAEMTQLAGQKAIVTHSRVSIAGFKIRRGMPIGCKVTLRRKRMYDFLERLIRIAIPRIRDFRGFSVRGFDGAGNYNLGVSEQIIFPEIDYDQVENLRGLNICITTSARSDAEGRALLAACGFPFREKG